MLEGLSERGRDRNNLSVSEATILPVDVVFVEPPLEVIVPKSPRDHLEAQRRYCESDAEVSRTMGEGYLTLVIVENLINSYIAWVDATVDPSFPNQPPRL